MINNNMSFNTVNVLFSIILLAIIVDINALSKCVEETPCSCHTNDGSYYDLTKLSSQGNLKSNSNKFNYEFSFRPCVNTKMDIIPGNASDCNNGTGVSLCASNGTNSFSLGSTAETTWDLAKNDPELELIHSTRKTRVTLVCCDVCKSSTLNLDEKPDDENYHLSLTSPYVCKIPKHRGGISTGSLLVILFFVLGGVYLIVGALALKFFRGAIGLEMIPNYDFWSSVPGLFRDGVVYTFSCCSANSYDRI